LPPCCLACCIVTLTFLTSSDAVNPPPHADYLCRYGHAATSPNPNEYGNCNGPPCETALATHVVCGFATTVANNSKPDAEAFKLASKADTTFIAVGASSATPSAVFAPLESVTYSGAKWMLNGRTLVTALSPHPTKVMFYNTINDAFFVTRDDYDIQSVGMIDFAPALAAPVATMHLDLKTSAAASIGTIRWNKLTPGPDGETVYLVGVIRGTTTLKYARYVPGSALEVQDQEFTGQVSTIVGIFG